MKTKQTLKGKKMILWQGSRNIQRCETRARTVSTHYFVGGGAGYGRASLLQEGLQEAHKRGDVPCALPERGLQQVREQSHVGGGDGVGVDLQQERHHLEHVRQEFCRARKQDREE